MDFQSTSWSIVRDLRDPLASGYREALESLVESYWPPVYAFIRRMGKDVHEAEDLAQAFFAHVLDRGTFEGVDEAKGTFRSYLRQAIRNFVVSEHRHRSARKRSPEGRLVPIEGLEVRLGGGALGAASPEAAFDFQWARDAIARARSRMAADCAASGRQLAFDVFDAYLSAYLSGEGPVDYRAIAARFGLERKKVDNFVYRGRIAFRNHLRTELVASVSSEEDLRRELDELATFLGDA